MRRIVPLLAVALMVATVHAQAQAPDITAPGVFVPPDLTKSFVPGGYQLGADVVKSYQHRGVTPTVLRDLAGMSDTLPRYDYERNIPIEGQSIPVSKDGAALFQTSHYDAPFTVFTAEIRSEDAVSTRLCLDLGHLKNGEEVWLASPLTGETYGPYYAHDDKPDGLWLPRVFGDTTLLIVRSVVNETPALSLKQVAHMYVPLQQLPPEFACLTNIACENDAGVQQLRTGVGLLSFGVPVNFVNGEFIFQFSLCSGTLLNNPVSPEQDPLFLTANHCIDSQLAAQTGEVIWDWESTQCLGFLAPQETNVVRVPIYLDRGALYDPRLGFPAELSFRLSFNEGVLALPNNEIIFEPNPRLGTWYGKQINVQRPGPGDPLVQNPFVDDAGTLIFRIPRSAHVGAIRAVAFSPSGDAVLTGGADNTARLWDSQLAAQTVTYSGHTGAVNGVAFSPDGSMVLTGSSDTTARLWNRVTGALIRTLGGHEDEVNAVAFSPDGTQVLTGSSDNTAKLWNVATGAEVRTFAVVQVGEEEIGHTGPVNGVDFSPNGAQVVTGSSDNTAIVWSRASGDPVVVLGGNEESAAHTDAINAVAFAPNGTQVLTGSSDNLAKLWSVGTGAVLLTFAGHSNDVNGVAFSPSGNRVVTVSSDNSGRVWDVANSLMLQVFNGHLDAVNAVAVSPNGQDVVSGSDDGTARLWTLGSATELRILSATEITTFDNQLPFVVPEAGRPQENPFLLGELVLLDVGGPGTSTAFRLFASQASGRFFGGVQVSTCSGGYSDSGALGGCVRGANRLTLFIPPLSRFSWPRSKVDCILATDSLVDATLLRLGASRGLYSDEPVEPAYLGRFYSGWTTRAPQIGEQVINVSHPAGVDKKFAAGEIMDTAATRRIHRFAFEDQIGVMFNRGLILGGSSGSGLFLDDGSYALVGITSNGPGNANCLIDAPNYFGSFAAFFPSIEEFIYRPSLPPCGFPAFSTQPLRHLRAMPVKDTGRVVLTWQRPTFEPSNLVLVRRLERFPRSISDGTAIPLATNQVLHIDEPLAPGQELFYGLFASYDGVAYGQREFARVVVGDATGPLTYEPMAEVFDPLQNPMDLSFSQLTFVPLVDFRAVGASDQPASYFNLSNYRLLYKPGVTEFPVAPGPGTIPLPFRELESISGRGANLISGPHPSVAQFLMKLPNPVPLFGRFNRDLVVSAQGFITFNSPAETVGLTQGDFSPLLLPTYAAHYQIPRISFLFAELSPQAGGLTWMRTMDDRIVVTFEDVPEWPTFPPRRSSVQTELFYNGQIRMTFLQVNAREAVVGLSDGKGVPIDPAQAEFVFPGRLTSDLTRFAAPFPLQLTPIPVLMGREGELISFTPTVTVPPGSPALTFHAVDEPFGLTVNSATGTISWPTTFTDSGVYQFDLVVTSGALAASQRVVVIVENTTLLPSALNVQVSPGIPNESDFLRVNYDYTHPEGIPEGNSPIHWFRNGQLVYALINQLFVPASLTRAGDRWYAEIVPTTVTRLQGPIARSNVVFIAAEGEIAAGGDGKLDADVNEDGKVDALDVQMVINDALNGPSKSPPRTDINRDGSVNALDVQLVINGALQ